MTDSNVSKSVQIAHISILYHALAYSNKDHEERVLSNACNVRHVITMRVDEWIIWSD